MLVVNVLCKNLIKSKCITAKNVTCNLFTKAEYLKKMAVAACVGGKHVSSAFKVNSREKFVIKTDFNAIEAKKGVHFTMMNCTLYVNRQFRLF